MDLSEREERDDNEHFSKTSLRLTFSVKKKDKNHCKVTALEEKKALDFFQGVVQAKCLYEQSWWKT